jgi:hypothetical protein
VRSIIYKLYEDFGQDEVNEILYLIYMEANTYVDDEDQN